MKIPNTLVYKLSGWVRIFTDRGDSHRNPDDRDVLEACINIEALSALNLLKADILCEPNP